MRFFQQPIRSSSVVGFNGLSDITLTPYHIMMIKNAEEKFKQISKAYQKLKDESGRIPITTLSKTDSCNKKLNYRDLCTDS